MAFLYCGEFVKTLLDVKKRCCCRVKNHRVFHNSRLIRWIQQDKIYQKNWRFGQGLNQIACWAVSHSSHYTRMFSVLVWGWNWILFMTDSVQFVLFIWLDENLFIFISKNENVWHCVMFKVSTPTVDYTITNALIIFKVHLHWAKSEREIAYRWLVRKFNVLFTLIGGEDQKKLWLSCSLSLNINWPLTLAKTLSDDISSHFGDATCQHTTLERIELIFQYVNTAHKHCTGPGRAQ